MLEPKPKPVTSVPTILEPLLEPRNRFWFREDTKEKSTSLPPPISAAATKRMINNRILGPDFGFINQFYSNLCRYLLFKVSGGTRVEEISCSFLLPGLLCSKTILVKAVGVVDTSPDTVVEMFLNVDKHRRYEEEPQVFDGMSHTKRRRFADVEAGNEAFQNDKHTEATDHYSAEISKSIESHSFAVVCFCNHVTPNQYLGEVIDDPNCKRDCLHLIKWGSSW
ncbi:unnamed protein product [Lactuca saligna]|uniref:Uncharacterized protein n=1 Tax=Lactuca saligna TaxID=75948 RepID=A0AA35YQQ2_LACSI|nr:unnamed protein product [Lactuca saligna]